jgi:hypothetical protein
MSRGFRSWRVVLGQLEKTLFVLRRRLNVEFSTRTAADIFTVSIRLPSFIAALTEL